MFVLLDEGVTFMQTVGVHYITTTHFIPEILCMYLVLDLE